MIGYVPVNPQAQEGEPSNLGDDENKNVIKKRALFLHSCLSCVLTLL